MQKYHYTECGLDNIYLLNGFEVMTFEDEQVVSVHNTEGLHLAIGTDILNKTSLLNGQELRFLRKEMGLSQKELAALFGKTDQTVANWEKGDSMQAQSDDIVIRLRYAAHIQANKDICDVLTRLALDEIERLERIFTEENDSWEQMPLAA